MQRCCNGVVTLSYLHWPQHPRAAAAYDTPEVRRCYNKVRQRCNAVPLCHCANTVCLGWVGSQGLDPCPAPDSTPALQVRRCCNSVTTLSYQRGLTTLPNPGPGTTWLRSLLPQALRCWLRRESQRCLSAAARPQRCSVVPSTSRPRCDHPTQTGHRGLLRSRAGQKRSCADQPVARASPALPQDTANGVCSGRRHVLAALERPAPAGVARWHWRAPFATRTSAATTGFTARVAALHEESARCASCCYVHHP